MSIATAAQPGENSPAQPSNASPHIRVFAWNRSCASCQYMPYVAEIVGNVAKDRNRPEENSRNIDDIGRFARKEMNSAETAAFFLEASGAKNNAKLHAE